MWIHGMVSLVDYTELTSKILVFIYILSNFKLKTKLTQKPLLFVKLLCITLLILGWSILNSFCTLLLM